MTNYEFHVTVRDAVKEEFIAFCNNINIKPIILELQTKESILLDVMTSHTKRLENDDQAYQELSRVVSLLKDAGYSVVREKIEADYTHPMVPINKSDLSADPQRYLESHLNIKIHGDDDPLKCLLFPLGFHVSRNVFKKMDDGYIIMATFRSHDMTLSEFTRYLSKSIVLLRENKFEIEKEIVEYAIYDSNVRWDSEWLKEHK